MGTWVRQVATPANELGCPQQGLTRKVERFGGEAGLREARKFGWGGDRMNERDQVHERQKLRTAARLRGRPGQARGLGVKGDNRGQFPRAAGGAHIAAAAGLDHGGTGREEARGSEEPDTGRRPFTWG